MQTPPRLIPPLPALRLALLLALLQAFAAGPAGAAQLQVTVLGLDGKPAANVVVQALPSAAWQAQPLPAPVEIAQQNIRFEPFVTVVPVGATVRFVNRDRFDHHVRSQPGGPLGNVPPAQQFEFRMAAVKSNGTAASAEIKLDTRSGRLFAGGRRTHCAQRRRLAYGMRSLGERLSARACRTHPRLTR